MLAYILRRLIWIVITLWGVSLLTFGMLFAGPTDAAQALSGARAQAASVEMLRQQLGLDRPVHEQYLDLSGQSGAGRSRRVVLLRTPGRRRPAGAISGDGAARADHLRAGGRARRSAGRRLGGAPRRARSTGR